MSSENPRISVSEINIYLPPPQTQQEEAGTEVQKQHLAAAASQSPAPVHIHDEAMPGPRIHDEEIERDEVRRGLPRDEANICISVMPGQRLGEIYVNVQYEGPKEEWNRCLTGQNDLTDQVARWLKEIFGQAASGWKVVINSAPCNKATEPLRIVDHARTIEGSEMRERIVGPVVEPKVRPRRDVKRQS